MFPFSGCDSRLKHGSPRKLSLLKTLWRFSEVYDSRDVYPPMIPYRRVRRRIVEQSDPRRVRAVLGARSSWTPLSLRGATGRVDLRGSFAPAWSRQASQSAYL